MELQHLAERILALVDEVSAFLKGCPAPNPYDDEQTLWGRERDLIDCIVWDQYVLTRDDTGTITGFMSYWKIDPADIPRIKSGETECDKIHGTHGWVVDVGCNGTSFRKLCRMLAIKGAPFDGVSSYHFKSQTHRQFTTGALARG